VSHDSRSNRLQNQYLVSATMRACYDNLQVRIEALRRWLSGLLVSTDADSDRAQSCLFKVITVLTCLSSGNQENVLDLAIREEHKQHVVYGLARYASSVLMNEDEQHDNGDGAVRTQQRGEEEADESVETNEAPKSSFRMNPTMMDDGEFDAEQDIPQPQIPGSAFVETNAHEMPAADTLRNPRMRR